MTNGQKIFIAIGVVAVYYLFIRKSSAATTAAPVFQPTATPYLPTSTTPKAQTPTTTPAQQQAALDQQRAAEVATNQEQQTNQSMQDLGMLPGSGSAQ